MVNVAYGEYNDWFSVKLSFTVYEGLKHANLCTITEVIQLDNSSIKRPDKPEYINSLH